MPSLHEFTVEQHRIRIVAREPDATSGESHAAIVLLHGAGGNLDFWISHFGPFLAQAGIALYAPHYFDRTGTVHADLSTIADGVHVPQWLATIDEAVRFATGRPGVDPSRVLVAGISLGAFLGLAFAAKLSSSDRVEERSRIRALVEISGGLVEPYASYATRSFAPALILHGAQDTVVSASHAEALDATLTRLDVAHRTEILAREGHWFTSAALPRMLLAVSSFLEAHLADGSAERPM